MFREGWEGGDCILTEGDSASVCRGYTINIVRLFIHTTKTLLLLCFCFILVSFTVDVLGWTLNCIRGSVPPETL